MPKTQQEALDELYKKAGYTGPKKVAPPVKPGMIDNYKTLGSKLASSAKKMIDQKKIIVDEEDGREAALRRRQMQRSR